MPSQFAGVGVPPAKVVLVGSDDEQRVFLGNAGGRQTGEELAEGDIILLGLRDIAGLARTESAGSAAVVMDVGDVGVDNVNTGFQHLRGIAERLGSGGIEGVRETRIAGCRLNDIAIEILDRTALGDHRLDMEVAKQGLEVGVTAGLVRQHIGTRMVVVAKRAVLRTVNGDTEEVGIGLVAHGDIVGFDAFR